MVHLLLEIAKVSQLRSNSQLPSLIQIKLMSECRTALMVYVLSFLFVLYFPPHPFQPHHFSSFTTLVVEDTHPPPIALLPLYTQIYLLGNAHLDCTSHFCSQKVRRFITSLEQLNHLDRNTLELHVQKDLFNIQHFKSEFINKLEGYTLYLPFKEQYASKCEANELKKTNRCKVSVEGENSTSQNQKAEEQQVDHWDSITASKQRLPSNQAQNIPIQVQNQEINSTVEPQIKAEENKLESEMVASQKTRSIQQNESPQTSLTDLNQVEPKDQTKSQNSSTLIENTLVNEPNEKQAFQQNEEPSADESQAYSQVQNNEMRHVVHSEAQMPLSLQNEFQSESKLQQKQQTKFQIEQKPIPAVENVEMVDLVEKLSLQKEKQMLISQEQGKTEARTIQETDNQSNKDASPNEASIANKSASQVFQRVQTIFLDTSPARNFWDQL